MCGWLLSFLFSYHSNDNVNNIGGINHEPSHSSTESWNQQNNLNKKYFNCIQTMLCQSSEVVPSQWSPCDHWTSSISCLWRSKLRHQSRWRLHQCQEELLASSWCVLDTHCQEACSSHHISSIDLQRTNKFSCSSPKQRLHQAWWRWTRHQSLWWVSLLNLKNNFSKERERDYLQMLTPLKLLPSETQYSFPEKNNILPSWYLS